MRAVLYPCLCQTVGATRGASRRQYKAHQSSFIDESNEELDEESSQNEPEERKSPKNELLAESGSSNAEPLSETSCDGCGSGEDAQTS